MSPTWIAVLICGGVLAFQTAAGIIFNRVVRRREEQERLDCLESGYYEYGEVDYEARTAEVDCEAPELDRLLRKGGA